MKRFLRAFITILIQLPVIFWFFLGISLYRKNDLLFGDIVHFLIFFSLIYITFFVAYTIERYNKHRFTIYLLLPLSLVVMDLFERSWIAQIILFLTYIILMGIFLRKERFSVFYKVVDSDISKRVARFDTKKQAKKLIKNSINRTLNKLAIGVSNDNELIDVYLENREIEYRINKKEFDDIKYVKKNGSFIYQQKLQSMIDGGFKLTEDQTILGLLKELEESEIVEVNTLQGFIEIVYIKDAKREYLSIKDTYYMNPQAGIGKYFEFKKEQLKKAITKQEIDHEKGMKEISYLKAQHPYLSDIYFILRAFYFENINHISKTGKIIIIYETKDRITNSATIYLSEEGIEIDKYEDIFKFSTNVLENELRTQLEYSYNDKYFEPRKYFDTIDKETKALKREKTGDKSYQFPCTTFGKSIWFGFDKKRGIRAYNLATFTNSYELINNNVYSHLDTKQKEKLHSFLAIAQLYLNHLFINKEFDNQLIIDTSVYLENHQKIENFEKSLKNSNWIKEDYFDNSSKDLKYPTRFAYICYDKKDTHRKFVFLEETDWVDRKVTLKFNDDIKLEIDGLF